MVVFLFVLGLFLVKGRLKWWLFAVFMVSVVLSWGHNFSLLTNFMLDYFPGYNKFRTVSMTLVMAEFAMPVLAIVGLREIISGNVQKKEFLKAWKYSFFGLSGLILILLISQDHLTCPVSMMNSSVHKVWIVLLMQFKRTALPCSVLMHSARSFLSYWLQLWFIMPT